ncbi:MAG: hypothetical protein R3F33_07745 [Planctomycetota bacterium]
MRPSLLALGLALLSGCMAPLPEAPAPPPHCDLDGDLAPLWQAFNECAGMPRALALVPTRCTLTEHCIEQMEEEARSWSGGRPVKWFVIWQDEWTGDGCPEADQASMALPCGEVRFFHDVKRQASRSLARGTVLSGTLQRAVLFYPAGVEWTAAQQPMPTAWVQSMGPAGPKAGGSEMQLAENLRRHWQVPDLR